MRYRPEIDGLRAIAVIPVILFHAGIPLFSGGFVGVDIFFVISGYLITTIILGELEAGRFSIVQFYERRARRILPALFVVVVTCLPVAWLWLMPSDVNELSSSVVAVLAFVSNIFFWQQSDYFDAATELKPLLHTWSLGVEEQFYVLFPIFLLLGWRLGRTRLVVLLTIAALLSLALAEYAASRKPVAAFFLLPTRGWELAVGALIAFYSGGKQGNQFSPTLSRSLSVVGLALITLAVLVFNKDTPFPGLNALVPTVGAGLLILSAWPGTLVGKLLGSRILVGIGLISYSAYLWHQPLLAFARHRSFTDPGAVLIAWMIVLTFGLAYVTWRFVEQPFRRKGVFTRRFVWNFSLVSSVIIASLAVSLQLSTPEKQSGLGDDAEALYRIKACLFSGRQSFETLLEHQCDSVQASHIPVQVDGARASKTFVLFGDSVAAHLYPGLVAVTEGDNFMQLTGTSCRAIRSMNDQRCADFYDWFVEQYVPNNQVDGIIVSSSWLKAYRQLGDKEFRVRLNRLFEKLKDNRVIVYSQPASLAVDIHRYVYKLEKFSMTVPGNLIVKADNLEEVNSALREEAAKFGFEFIDASQLFCEKDQCTAAHEGMFYFWDTVHLTKPGSVALAGVTYDLLSEAHPAHSHRGQNGSEVDRTHSAEALMVRNLDGTIRYWSDGAKKLYGWEPHDVLGTTSHQLLKTVFPLPLEVIEKELRTKGHWEGQLIHECRDGSKMTVASRWDLRQKSSFQDRESTVIEINGPLSSPSSGSLADNCLRS